MPPLLLGAATYGTITYGMASLRMEQHPALDGQAALDGLAASPAAAAAGGASSALAAYLCLAMALVLVAAQFSHLAVALAPSPDVAFGITTVFAALNLFFAGAHGGGLNYKRARSSVWVQLVCVQGLNPRRR